MNKADLIFKETVKNIMENGVMDINPRPKYKDGTPAHTKFINHVVHTYDLEKGELPLITLRNIAIKNGIKEILWIYQDQSSDLSVLKEKYNIHWWDEWESKDMPGTIGRRYGATVKKYDLMNKLLDGIKSDPYGRRHIISLWQENDFEETDGLKPCAFMTIFNVRGEFLDMALIQRSSDFITAGNINQVQYVAFLMMVARHCGYKPGKFTHFIDNVQVYDRHFDAARELLNREAIECNPRLILNPEKKDFYDFTVDDFILEGYPREEINEKNPQLKLEIGI
ncbi:MAG: thymidylate synthase [Bacilli bacterium]|nr:thymidylate synthase [Bacilli bacterium]